MQVVVYTADIGGHDRMHEPARQEVPEDWEVRFHRWSNPSHHPESPWRTAWHEREIWDVFEDLGLPEYASDRLLGRWAKCHPFILHPEATYSIWVDASVEVTSPTFVYDVVWAMRSWGLGVFSHPDRANVYDEADAAAPMVKYQGAPHGEMLDAYSEALGSPIPGLWAMGVLVRRNVPSARLIDHWVWSETLRWSRPSATVLDQLILPFVLAALDYDVIDVSRPGQTLWANDWFKIHEHNRET